MSAPDPQVKPSSPVFDHYRHARRAMEVLGARGTRMALLTASLLAGLVIALLTVHLAGSWQLVQPGPHR